jgi:hypothetical protein
VDVIAVVLVAEHLGRVPRQPVVVVARNQKRRRIERVPARLVVVGDGHLDDLGALPPERHQVVAAHGQLCYPLDGALLRERAHGPMLRPLGRGRNPTFLE